MFAYGRVVKMAFDSKGNRDRGNDIVVITERDGYDVELGECPPMPRYQAISEMRMPAGAFLFGDSDLQVITRREAIRRLGSNVIVAVDETPDKEDWFWFPETGKIGTIDGRLCETEIVLVNGSPYLVLKEEPGRVSDPEDGSPRIVGQVIIFRNNHGLIRVRRGLGVNGEVLELNSSSYTKGETVKYAPTGSHYELNAKRVRGFVEPILVDGADFPDHEGMTVQDFVAMSTDARAITALAKLGLLVAA